MIDIITDSLWSPMIDIVGSCLACTLHTTTRISNVKSIYCKIGERCHKHGISFVLCIGYMYFGKTAYYVLIAAEPECKCFNVQSHHTIHTKEIGLGESDLDNNVTTILCIFETSKTLTAPAWSTATWRQPNLKLQLWRLKNPRWVPPRYLK